MMKRSTNSEGSNRFGGVDLEKRSRDVDDVVAQELIKCFKMKRCETSTTTRSRVSAGRALPRELIYDILSRLRVKVLMRFKFACKSWQAIVSDPCFIASHLQREKEHFRVLMIPIYGSGTFSSLMELEDKSSSSKPEILDIPGLEAMARASAKPSHCDGLLLFDCVEKMHVFNPATRELVTIPRGSPTIKPKFHDMLSDQSAVIGQDPSNKKYKIVCCFYRSYDYISHSCSLGLEVLTLGGKWCRWVTVQDPPYPIYSTFPVHVRGVIYWYIDNRLHQSSPQAILCFNMSDYEYALVPPPPICSVVTRLYEVSTISELDGNLSCLIRWNSLYHVYVYRKDEGKECHGVWHVMYTASVAIIRHRGLGPILFFQNGKILICRDDCLHCYDPQTQTMGPVAGSMNRWPTFSSNKYKNTWGVIWMHATRYIESMVRIN